MLAVGAFLWLRLTTVEGLRVVKIWPRTVAVTSVIARRETEPAPPLRVVFHTPLDTLDLGRSTVPTWLATSVIGLILIVQVIIDMTIHANPLHLPAWSGPFFLGLLWLAIMGRLWRSVRRPGGPDVRDNRTGLAVLLELARVWPPGTHSRIETRFATTGGRALDQAGLRALIRAIDSEWPARPTLVVEWLAPGLGPGLALMEQGTGRLAETAARDLWIPHHVIHHSGLHREHWPFGRRGPGYIGMVGPITEAPDAPARAIDPDALARTAQLATEVALRWARGKHVSTKIE
jgi:hypothetical protein